MRRAFVALVGAIAVATTSVSAGTQISKAATALRADPVYVAAGANPTLAPAEAATLRTRIREQGTPIFIAVLPERALAEVDGPPDLLPRALYEATGRPGAYGIIAGRNFRAASSLDIGLDAGEAGRIATGAFEANHPSTTGGRVLPMLEDWVGRVQAAIAAPPAPVPGGNGDAPRVEVDPGLGYPPQVYGSGDPGLPTGVVILFIAFGVVAAVAGALGIVGPGRPFGTLGRLARPTGAGLWLPSLWPGRRRGRMSPGWDDVFFSSSSPFTRSGGGFDSPSDVGGGSWGGASGGSSGSGGFDSGSGGGSW